MIVSDAGWDMIGFRQVQTARCAVLTCVALLAFLVGECYTLPPTLTHKFTRSTLACRRDSWFVSRRNASERRPTLTLAGETAFPRSIWRLWVQCGPAGMPCYGPFFSKNVCVGRFAVGSVWVSVMARTSHDLTRMLAINVSIAILKPSLDDTTCFNRLSNRFHNPFDNRLYRCRRKRFTFAVISWWVSCFCFWF